MSAKQVGQRGPVARGGKSDPVEVEVEVEVRVVLPVRPRDRRRSFDHPLPEARVGLDEALADQLAHAVPVGGLFEPVDPGDHHQVGRLVHVEPCRVRVVHRLCLAHGTSICPVARPRGRLPPSTGPAGDPVSRVPEPPTPVAGRNESPRTGRGVDSTPISCPCPGDGPNFGPAPPRASRCRFDTYLVLNRPGDGRGAHRAAGAACDRLPRPGARRRVGRR